MIIALGESSMLFVKDIMTKPVIVIRSSATIENAIWLMRT